MKLIVAGGRDYKGNVARWIDFAEIEVTEVVSGGATGADRLGEEYAEARGIPVRHFIPNWKDYGRAAGPMRNKEMAEYADAVALFAGGKGTDSMYQEAKKAGIQVYDFRSAND